MEHWMYSLLAEAFYYTDDYAGWLGRPLGR